MNGNIIGLFLYYWVFILGALFAIKMFNVTDDDGLIPILIVLTVFYFGFQYIRSRGPEQKGKIASFVC
jgi:hypothetical protein